MRMASQLEEPRQSKMVRYSQEASQPESSLLQELSPQPKVVPERGESSSLKLAPETDEALVPKSEVLHQPKMVPQLVGPQPELTPQLDVGPKLEMVSQLESPSRSKVVRQPEAEPQAKTVRQPEAESQTKVVRQPEAEPRTKVVRHSKVIPKLEMVCDEKSLKFSTSPVETNKKNLKLAKENKSVNEETVTQEKSSG